ncbi:MAG TPA: hypothetical protein VKB34_23005, partial [Povalibacter sp.]|nr:hypothetical protein [Povalibacter sp.]
PWLGLQRALLWGTFAVCLVTVVACIDLRFSWHWPQPLTLLGDASYSLYLLQPLTLALAARLVPALDAWTGIVFVLGTILLGLLTWRFVERPLTRALRQSARRQIATTRQPDSAPLREAP